MNTSSCKYFSSAVLLSLLTWTSTSTLADIVLHPGYLSGQFTIGDYNVQSANISASGNNYSASKSVTGDSYTLTVEGGNWDYSVGANVLIRPVDASYPYTRMYFNNRSAQIPVGSTVTNDYSFGVGTPAAAATVRFEVNITGDAYNSWTGYGYALQNVDPDVGERTSSQSYTHSTYSPTGAWNMPVVPNNDVRIYATVRLYNIIDNRGYYTNYSFWTTSPYLYEGIEPGEILPVKLEINHVAPTPDIPEDPQYEYGSVNGTVEFTTLPDPAAFVRHRVTASGRRYYSQHLLVNTLTAPYGFASVQTDDPSTYTLRPYSWFDNNQTYLQWSCEQGDCVNNQLVVRANQNHVKDFSSDVGLLTGTLKFSGTLENENLTSYKLSANTRHYYDSLLGWVYPPTYGGSASHTGSGIGADGTYRLFGQEGPWLPWTVSAYKNVYLNGYRSSFSLGINDYNFYYDGSTNDFGSPSDIVAGTTLVKDREYCTGSVVVRFRDESGGLLSYPSLSGYGNRYNDNGERELYASMSGSFSIPNALEPTIELHGPTADYNLYNIRFRAQDGTYLTFPGFPIALECGVRKGVPISGKPKIVVEQPPAYHLTSAETVTVSGTAADDTGIASMTMNDNPVETQPTGNPENEVSFNYELTLADGTNTIVTTATDLDGNESFDERPIYVDRWPPTVTIVTPADGAVFANPQATVPVEVTGSDQGYGFTLKVYYDSELILEAAGPANEGAAESYTVNTTIGPMELGAHLIRAEITDAAGNSASDSVTITTNTAPMAVDDAYTINEDLPLSVPAPGLLSNDTDVDGDTLTVLESTPPANGVLAINPDGSFSYTPNPDYNGTDSFSYTISDANGGSDTGLVSLTIAPVNDAPVANEDSYSTDEDVPLNVPAPGVLTNDTDVDGDTLTVTDSTPPANGVLATNPDGSFSYTPNPDYNGTDSFTYTVSDANGGSDTVQVSLTIAAVNDAPVANEDSYSTAEDVPLSVPAPGVLANDTDVDGDTLTVLESTPPANGVLAMNPDGSFSYTPNPDYNGTDSFTYTVSDANGGSDTVLVSLTIASVNDPPVANEDSYSTAEDVPLSVPAPGVLANDTDVDGDTLTVTDSTPPANGVLAMNPDGSFSYTPNPDFNGVDNFTYQVDDGVLKSGITTVTITVTAVNDPPLVSIDLASQQVQYSDRIVPVTITAVDIDSATLALTPSELPGSLTTSGGCTASGDGSNCTWTLEGQNLSGAGTYAITLAPSDDEYAPSVSTELRVVQEDASAAFDDENPTSVLVATDGGDSGMFDLVARVTETVPDLPTDWAAPGDISRANVTMILVPVGPGPSVAGMNCVPDNSVEAVQTVTCSFSGVPVETYTVEVTIDGDYYIGSAEDVLTVYDPSLGHTTGGGWFYWPDTTDKTNFGYTMKYGKKGNNVKGSLLLIRHLAEGGKYRIKSNALSGLAIGENAQVPYGWASFSGRSTYLEPGMPEPEGNHGFTAYVEDRNEPGSGADRFWITTRAKDGSVIPAMSLGEPAPDHAVSIMGGNIVAPH